jgi:hypothetical protein
MPDDILVRTHHVGHRWLIATYKTHKHKAVPNFKINRRQAVFDRVKLGERLGLGHGAQRSIEIIGPAVERTDDGRLAGAPFGGHNPAAAVAANIMESPHHIVLAAHNERPLADEIKAVIIANIGNIAHMAGYLPGLAKQLVLLDFKEFRIGIGPARQTAPFVVIQPGPNH